MTCFGSDTTSMNLMRASAAISVSVQPLHLLSR